MRPLSGWASEIHRRENWQLVAWGVTVAVMSEREQFFAKAEREIMGLVSWTSGKSVLCSASNRTSLVEGEAGRLHRNRVGSFLHKN